MAIKKYLATKDNTITNGFGVNLSTRATGSNMGASDILEVHSIYGQQLTANTTSSVELSRVLIQFPVNKILSDRLANKIPVSGSVSFFLRMFNARHSEQLPKNYTVNILAVSQSWEEGYGLDMETYSDKTNSSIEGSNWMNCLSTTAWNKPGGDYHSSSYVAGSTMPNYTFTFANGTEDILLDVTSAIEEWVAGTQTNNGFGVFLSSSYEGYASNSSGVDENEILHNPVGSQMSFYTKRFFSRSSEFFFKRPSLEARWDSRMMDDRGNFYASSSVAPAIDNLNKLYLYNYIRGTLKDIPSSGETLSVKLYASSDNMPVGAPLTTVTAGKYNNSTGIYTASVSLETTSSVIHDVWSGSVGGEYKTGSISVKNFNSSDVLLSNDYNQFTTKITNLKSRYTKDEIARFRVFSRLRNFKPTIYTVANSEIQHTIVSSASFEIFRTIDNQAVINNSTGSATRHTYLSYDNSGSYFDLDMSLLEPGYMYGIRLFLHSSDGWREQEEAFNFRVEDN